MEHFSLYQRFRPNSFSEVVGQDHIVSVLKGAIEKNQIGHAYLFIGDRGLGKTSIARIFAKDLGVSRVDVIEIDAASHRGIDAIRVLNEQVYARPLESPYKVYIIDEVHMLTKDAFNALLKTIEEPPSFCIFILATTEPHKVLQTIRSRCQEFTFHRASKTDLVKLMKQVLETEKVVYEEAALESLAILGDGSYRDTLSHLQKIITASEKEGITADLLQIVSGVPPLELQEKLIEILVTGKDTKEALEIIKKFTEASLSPLVVLEVLLEGLRNALVSGKTQNQTKIIALMEKLLEVQIKTKRTDRSFVSLELAIITSFMHSSA